MEAKTVIFLGDELAVKHHELLRLLALCKELNAAQKRARNEYHAADERKLTLYGSESTLTERQAADAASRDLFRAFCAIDERYGEARRDYFEKLSAFHAACAKALQLAPHGIRKERADFPWMDT